MMDASTRDMLLQLLSHSLAENVTSLGGVQALAPEAWPLSHSPRASQRPEQALLSEQALLIVLTLSGYRFQSLLCVLAHTEQATVTLEDDPFQELANTLCGSLKRHLMQYCPGVGMSTPNRLPVECLPYLWRHGLLGNASGGNASGGNGSGDNGSGRDDAQNVLPPLTVHCVTSDGVALYAGLLLHDSEAFTLPAAASAPMTSEHSSGELELF